MSLDATSFKSPGLIDKIDETFPKFKEIRENPKVIAVAKQVFKALACIAVGAGLGLLACTPLGISVGMGMGVGAAVGAIVFVAVAGVHAAIQALGFPINSHLVASPVSKDKWFSDESHKKFIKVLKKVAENPFFKDWLRKRNMTPAEGANYLWKEFQGGLCQGQSQSLITLMKKRHELKGEDLLGKLKEKEVFERQILEIIRADLPDNKEVMDLAKNIPNTERLFRKSFSKSALENDSSLLFNQLKDEKNKLKDSFQCLNATIRLQNKKDPSHTIFVELHPTYRIYDASNHIYTGLYEGFESEEQFLNSLQKHIESYHSTIRMAALKYDEIIIRGYMVDQTEARDAPNLAKAGAMPMGFDSTIEI